jgi:hypothetical protein
MRISLRDVHGKELDSASVTDGRDAPAEAMLLLARRARLDPGDLLVVDDNTASQEPDKSPGAPVTLTAGNLQSLAGRLEHRAAVVASAQPLSAEDLRTAARFCRHALKVGWVGKTSGAIADAKSGNTGPASCRAFFAF